MDCAVIAMLRCNGRARPESSRGIAFALVYGMSFVCDNTNDSRRNSERLQATIFRHPQERQQSVSVSGVSIAFDRLLQVVIEDVRRTRHLSSFPYRQDTYVALC